MGKGSASWVFPEARLIAAQACFYSGSEKQLVTLFKVITVTGRPQQLGLNQDSKVDKVRPGYLRTHLKGNSLTDP